MIRLRKRRFGYDAPTELRSFFGDRIYKYFAATRLSENRPLERTRPFSQREKGAQHARRYPRSTMRLISAFA
jgi:hypothetical protein